MIKLNKDPNNKETAGLQIKEITRQMGKLNRKIQTQEEGSPERLENERLL